MGRIAHLRRRSQRSRAAEKPLRGSGAFSVLTIARTADTCGAGVSRTVAFVNDRVRCTISNGANRGASSRDILRVAFWRVGATERERGSPHFSPVALGRRSGKGIACCPGVVPVLAVSTAECVAALNLAGFRPCRSEGSETILENELRRVVVPESALLEEKQLRAVLDAAAIPYSEFLELLSRAYAEPDTSPGVAESGVRAAVLCREAG